MSAEVQRDHHNLRIAPVIRREPIRRWFAVGIGAVGIAFLPLPLINQAIAICILIVTGLIARDRRKTELVLGHDTLTVETNRLGWPVHYRAAWDVVKIDSSWEPMALKAELGEVSLRIPWAGSRASLEEAVNSLREAQEAFVPGQDQVEPPPDNLAALRASQDATRDHRPQQ